MAAPAAAVAKKVAEEAGRQAAKKAAAKNAGGKNGGNNPADQLRRAGGNDEQERENRQRRQRGMLIVVSIPLAVVLFFCVILLAVFVGQQAQSMHSWGDAYPTGSGIPLVYWPMYVSAATYYKVSPYLLASIHKQETDFSTAQSTKGGFNANGCCGGPMQFNIKAGTWTEYENAFRPIKDERPVAFYPSDRRQLPSCQSVPVDTGCVYDDFDAIAAAAKLLKQSGADTSLYSAGTHQAVCSYIGSCAEVNECTHSENQYCEVLPRAQQWELKATTTASGPIRERIATIAQGQHDKGVHEGSGNCNPYGPCDFWCAMFSTWVWERAGIPIRTKMYRDGLNPFWVPDLEVYAKAHGLWHSTPRVGDMIIWEEHVGLIVRVDGGGRVVEIGGNQSDAVTELTGLPAGLGEGTPNGFFSPPEGGKSAA